MSKFSIVNYKYFLAEPNHVDLRSAWNEHTPFAFFLIEILKPHILVELGTHTGVSFNAFCQAARDLNLFCKFYAVDTWRGDEHSKLYGDEIYNELQMRQIKNKYTSFAQLMRMTFNEASKYFNECSIDLLHIDGYHTYEAVKNDFITWINKMSDKGVILLHDTLVRRANFGVWKLWEELKTQYPSLEFTHGYGLGVLAVGKNVPYEFILFIEEANNNIFYKKLFEKLGSFVFLKNNYESTRSELESTRSELESTRSELDKIRNSNTYRIAVKLEKIARKTKLIYPLKWMLKLYKKLFGK